MPYRVAEKPAVTPLRCCGLCDPTVGGCFRGLRFTRIPKHLSGFWGLFARRGAGAAEADGVPAGISRKRPKGTPAMVSFDDGVTWEEEP